MNDFLIKTVIIGSEGVGKSTILSNYNNNTKLVVPTIGVDFFSTLVRWNRNAVKMQIWDTSGNILYRSIIKAYFKTAVSVIGVFDLGKLSTLRNLDEMLGDYVRERSQYNAILIVGNFFGRREIGNLEIEKLCKKYKAFYVEVDSKNDRVDIIFKRLVEIILEDYRMNPNIFRNIEGFRDDRRIHNNYEMMEDNCCKCVIL